MPRRCLLCGLPAGEAQLCAGCEADLPRVGLACPCCGIAVPTAGLCAECLQHPPGFSATLAPLAYSGTARYLVTQFKYQRRLSCAQPLVHALLQAAQAREDDLPQALLPVPIHPSRLSERGFNQSLELARPLGKALGIAVLPDALRRVRATVPQNQLAEDERIANVRGVFALRDGVTLPEHVAIVDDVLTTGATARELTRVLRKHGCKRVEVWCASRAL
ncbi:MAG: ComF family protein [Pseudomonadota bacterium]